MYIFVSFERFLKGNYFIKDTTQHPNITRIVIMRILTHLRWQIIRSACLSPSHLMSVFQLLTNSKITQFQHTLFSNKYILRLNVSMQYFMIMQILNSQSQLSKPIDNQRLFQKSTCLLSIPYEFIQITWLGILHNNCQLTRMSTEWIFIGNDMWTSQWLK
jgi:hypothetical protein